MTMDELQENAARRLIDGYAEERNEERRRILFDFVATALASQGARFSDGIRLGADVLVYTARMWRGMDDEQHAWANAVQTDLVAFFHDRNASLSQALLALAHFQATAALALCEPGDGEGQ